MGKINYENSAKQILEAIGGQSNVQNAAHCATRLRLVLVDEGKIDHEKLSAIDVVKGDFSNAGQFQIIIGSGTVNEVYKEFIKLANIEGGTKAEIKIAADKKLNPAQKLVKMLSDVFVPILPALVASGLLMGLNNILSASDLFYAGKSLIEVHSELADLAAMINTFASAAYTFLPILIGFSATKMFGGNPYLGAVIGMIMVHPDLLNAYSYGDAILNNSIPTWNILGFAIDKVGYQGTVLPVLASSFILAKIEIQLHKRIPEALDNLLTPLISILVTAVLTFVCVGGIMRGVGDIVTNLILWLHDSLGIIGGMIFGFFYAPLTMTGMHHSLLPIDIQLIAAGGSFIFGIAAANNVAQGAAALAAMRITDDKKMKGTAASSGISALLGITEPAMFGVNLKMKFPFYGAMIGSALGAIYMTLTNVLSISPGSAGLIGFVCVRSSDIINFFIGVIIAMIGAYITTYILSKYMKKTENKTINLPATGIVKDITKSTDPTFNSKAMGEGIMIKPDNGKIYAPGNGKITMIFPTKHALGIMLDNGVELLIHCGIDTVRLNGKGFTSYIEPGTKVKAGQLLLEMDLDIIKDAGYSDEILMVVTNAVPVKHVEKDNKIIGLLKQ